MEWLGSGFLYRPMFCVRQTTARSSNNVDNTLTLQTRVRPIKLDSFGNKCWKAEHSFDVILLLPPIETLTITRTKG